MASLVSQLAVITRASPEEQFEQAHQTMLSYGMVLSNSEEDTYDTYQVPYGKKGSPIYLELHKTLLSSKFEAYGDLNRFFAHSPIWKYRVNFKRRY